MTIAMNKIECIDNRRFTEQGIMELAENIGQVGLLQPIRLKSTGKGRFKVIDGRRRFRAMEYRKAEVLGNDEYIIARNGRDENIEAFCANFHRENLSLAEEVGQLSALKNDSMTIEELATIVGKTPRWTALRLNLANLSGQWKKVLENRAEYPQWTPRLLEEIAKYPAKTQEVFESEIDSVITLDEIRELFEDKFERELAAAVFPKNDCTNCNRKSSCGLLLFEDETEKCLDPECYVNKQVKFIENELKKIQDSNTKIHQISGGYSGYNSPFSKFEAQRLPSHAFEVEESGEPNAIYVSGEKAGQYCRIKIKEHAKSLADSLIVTSPVESANNENTGRKEKKLEEREEELKRKRTKKAIELMKEYVESADSFDVIIAKLKNSKEIAITLATMFGTNSLGGYPYDIAKCYEEANANLKSSPDAFIRHCWNSIKRSIGNRLGQELAKTLPNVSESEAKVFCEILSLDYAGMFFSKASESIQPSKALLEAREKAAAQVA